MYKNKKNLKSKKIVVTESLTAVRLALLNKAKDKFGIKDVWSVEGRICARSDGFLVNISSEDDLL